MHSLIPSPRALFEPDHSIAWKLIHSAELPWDFLDAIANFIAEYGSKLSSSEFRQLPNHIYISKSAIISPTAYIGPCTIIDAGAEIRHCAYIRGSTIIGKRAVVGNSCELKNCILSDDVQVPHFNYVGDSILGWKAHLGAGVITSNVKSDKSEITIKAEGTTIRTGRRKLGAILGDHVEIGCNSVLFPGTIIGRNTTVYPLTRVRGILPADSICKSEGNLVSKH